MSILRAGCIYCCWLAVALVQVSSGCAQAQTTPAASEQESSSSFEELSAQAASFRDAGKIDEAIRCYQSALKLHRDWPEGWWFVGTMNYDADRFSDAIPAFQNLIALAPQAGPAVAFLGLSEFGVSDYKNALMHLRKARELGYGEDAQLVKVAEYHLAMLLNWNGEFEKSLETLGSSLGRGNPSPQIKSVMGMALLRIPLLPSQVDSSNDALLQSAGEIAALLAGNLDAQAPQVLEAFQNLLQEYPKTPYLHLAYGDALSSAGRREDALAQFLQEAKREESKTAKSETASASALPYQRMAAIHLALHHPKEALPLAQKAVRLAPEAAEAHRVLAQTWQETGENENAVRELELATRLETKPVPVEASQRQLYARLSTGESTVVPQVLSQQAAAGTVNPLPTESQTTFESFVRQASAAQMAGQIAAASGFYQHALTLRPEWEEGWRNLGTMLYSSAQYSAAIAAFKNAAALRPSEGDLWALLGLSEFEIQDYKNSLIHLERGRDLGLAANAAAVQIAKYHLAVLLIRNKEFDSATELLTPEAASGPAQPQIKLALGLALLRVPVLPQELARAQFPLMQAAGEAAFLLAQSKYDQAFVVFQQLQREYPGTPYLHYAYGSALASASRYDDAEAELAKETKITPASSLPFLRRASLALQTRHLEAAAQFSQQALLLTPETGEGHYLLGRACLELGQTTKAVKELETARDLAPNSPDVHFSLARAYTKSNQPNAAEKERAVFERLNAAVQTQRSRQGSQAYGAQQGQNGIRTATGSQQPNAAHQ